MTQSLSWLSPLMWRCTCRLQSGAAGVHLPAAALHGTLLPAHGQHVSFLGTWRQQLYPKQQAGCIWRDGACWALRWGFLHPGKIFSSLRAAYLQICFGQCYCCPSENCSLGLSSLCHLSLIFSMNIRRFVSSWKSKFPILISSVLSLSGVSAPPC